MLCLRSRPRTWLWASILAAPLATAPAIGQESGAAGRELIRDVQAQERLKAQQIEHEYRSLLLQIEKQAAANKADARESIEKLIADLKAEPQLPTDKRETLIRTAKLKLQWLDRAAAEDATGKPTPRVSNDDQAKMDQSIVEYRLKGIRELQIKGKHEEARKEAQLLAQEFPNNEAVRAAKRMVIAGEQLQQARAARNERDAGLSAASREMTKSATPPAGELDFPKDWKERTKGRDSAIALSAKEKAVLNALSTPLTVQYKGKRLEEVIDELQARVGVPILLDRLALKEAEVTYDSQVTLSAKGVSLRTILRKIFAEYNMTYVIKDELIQVVSAEQARNTMIVRRYYVGDILAGMSDPTAMQAVAPAPVSGLAGLPAPFGYPQLPGFGGLAGAGVPTGAQLQASMITNARNLIEMIQTSVEPASWKSSQGEGTIAFHAPSMSLVIKQSAEVHAILGNSMAGK